MLLKELITETAADKLPRFGKDNFLGIAYSLSVDKSNQTYHIFISKPLGDPAKVESIVTQSG